MHQWIKDTAGLGTGLWLVGYLSSLLLFQATYYGFDVFVYYALTFAIPVGVGVYLRRAAGK